ncbi:Transcription factor [Fulvia fulva]|uniref:Transcription factor n=1 Tax=Passalora fulva TaxID=5499 RepID=A0A9Q8P832_PASFU|nr:Transcription factor [Fulvia fulva]KAK4626204.1 Transcription factor [Fulvia fulva]KAK4627912.1 Transcription factor [Fulvia fulva]UJO16532.1 Transcription factor [Fulvia fulva]WPV13909.1 Transcription factor [Fulvia fulva]WPV29026.1 Transcription factor [Fulvia fulva]
MLSPANSAFSAAPSPAFQPVPIPGNGSLGVATPTIIDYDFWDQSILSSTNWLGAIDENGFHGYPMSQFPITHDPLYPLHPALGPSPAQSALLQAHVSQAASASPGSVLSAPSTNATRSYSSEQSHDHDTGETGAYYVDGQPARLPRIKRRRTSAPTPPDRPRTDVVFSLRLPDLSEEPQTCYFKVEQGCFTALHELHLHLCIHPPPGCIAFEPVELPSQEVINHLVAWYVKHFDQALPFLHVVDAENIGRDQNLILAMATIGSQYLEGKGSSMFRSSLHEFLRRLMLFKQATTVLPTPFDFCHMGAELLQVVALAYSGEQSLENYAKGLYNKLTDVFEGARGIALSLQVSSENGSDSIHNWHLWRQRERVIRLAYSAWLVDCMSQYHLDLRQMLSLKDADLPLPSDERQWRAETEQEWGSFGEARAQPTLSQALQELYVDKRLPRDRGEFARILIIHGLYHRLWEVGQYLSDPLSHWEPTARRQSSSELLPQEPIWLPSVPTFMKWQNSACDCLDVLHWQANATIGQASGLEHPTVLHLHTARIVLLTPYTEIVRLARAMSARNSGAASPSLASDRKLVQRWAVQQQFKARLAIVHAGVVFWHVRRYSIDAYYEAPAVALAALVLWAFGTFASKRDLTRQEPQACSSQPKTLREGQDLINESEQGDDAVCGIILLDRPADDEIVQQFIRTGHNMKAHITGVGDLYSSKGPERVLAQGAKLLSTLKCWGMSTSWLKLLNGLMEATRKGNGSVASGTSRVSQPL